MQIGFGTVPGYTVQRSGFSVNIMRSIYCALTGRCDPPAGEAVIKSTEQAMKSLDEAWKPVIETIRTEERERPNLARALREARHLHEQTMVGNARDR